MNIDYAMQRWLPFLTIVCLMYVSALFGETLVRQTSRELQLSVSFVGALFIDALYHKLKIKAY